MRPVANPENTYRPVTILIGGTIAVPLPTVFLQPFVYFRPADQLEPFEERGCSVDPFDPSRVPRGHQPDVMLLAVPSPRLPDSRTLR